MTEMESFYADYGNVPLPYLIRPRKELPTYDILGFHNDALSDDESDQNDSSMEAVETSSLNEDNSSGHRNERNESVSEKGDSLTDEEYVVVDNVSAMPQSKTEKEGAIQMMDLSKDAGDEAESDDGGSTNSDNWVVV